MTDFFDWNEPSQEIIKKTLEKRELDNATERLKDEVESSVDQNFNQYNFEEILKDREQVIMSIMNSLGPRIDRLNDLDERIEEREDEEEFKQDKQDNAIDTEDYQRLKTAYNQLKQVQSQTVLMFWPAYISAQDVGRALDIEQKQANQAEVLDKVNDLISGTEDLGERIGRQIADSINDGVKGSLEDLMSEKDEKIEELQRDLDVKTEKVEELEDELDSVSGETLGFGGVDELSSDQAEIYSYVVANPDADNDEIAEETDTAPNQVPLQLNRIRDSGWPLPDSIG